MDTVNEVTKNGSSLLKEAGKFGVGAVVGVSTFMLVKKIAGFKHGQTKKIDAAEEVDIDEDEYDVEEAEEN